MKITVVTPADLGASEIAAWRILQKGSPELTNPFLCPEFTLAVGRHREQARVAIIEDGNRVTGFFPFERQGLGTGKPIGAGLTDAQGAILAPEANLDVPSLLKACGLNVWEFDHLVAGQFPGHHTSRHPSPIIDLRAGLDTYLETIKKNSGKTYKSTAYKERKLGRDTGETRHDYAISDPAALHTLQAGRAETRRRWWQREPSATTPAAPAPKRGNTWNWRTSPGPRLSRILGEFVLRTSRRPSSPRTRRGAEGALLRVCRGTARTRVEPLHGCRPAHRRLPGKASGHHGPGAYRDPTGMMPGRWIRLGPRRSG
ncbi:hypothetical protein AB0392_17290 [Nonomuraea angiospora]|uniref:GNAT family N-acetyltransferase n=1 Tax=Nonomuraea angiospora TaxID=46172 RepID=UPI00344CA1E2